MSIAVAIGNAGQLEEGEWMKGSHGRRSSDSVIQGVLLSSKRGGIGVGRKAGAGGPPKPSKALKKVMRRFGIDPSSASKKKGKTRAIPNDGLSAGLMKKIREGSLRYIEAREAAGGDRTDKKPARKHIRRPALAVPAPTPAPENAHLRPGLSVVDLPLTR